MDASEDLGSLSELRLPLPDAVVRYAAHDDGLVDVHLPARASTPAPLVVLLHGGFWKQAYDRRHTRATAAALAAEGYVVATPEYRRVGGAGGWPATAEDVDEAVGAIPGLLAGLGVATTGTTVVGHSAGGHLALWLANRDHPVDRVVGLAAVADLRLAARLGLGDHATEALLGGSPEQRPDAYEAADPVTRFAERPKCDVVLVHGDLDDVVPLSVSRALVAAHPFVELHVVEAADHFDVVNPESTAWDVVLRALSR